MADGWEWKELGELCDLRTGSTPSRSNPAYWSGGDIPWLTIDDIRSQGRRIRSTKITLTNAALDETSVTLLPAGSVLLCCTASVGEYAILTLPATTNQQFVGMVVRDRTQLSPDFLFNFVSTLEHELLLLSGRTTIDFVPLGRLRRIIMPVPPLVEQRRIVDLMAVIDDYHRAVEAVESRTASAEEAVAVAQFANCADCPSEPLGNLLREPSALSYGVLKPGEFVDDGVPLVRSQDINDGSVALTNVVRVTPGAVAANRRTQLTGGELLVTVVGRIGYAAVAPTELAGANVSRAVAVARLSNRVDPRYVVAFLNSPLGRQALRAITTGAVQPVVSLGTLRGVPIPVPSLSSQQVVIAQVGALRDLRLSARRLAPRVAVARTAVLESLLTGNWSIPDSYDRLLDGAA